MMTALCLVAYVLFLGAQKCKIGKKELGFRKWGF